MRAHCLSLAAGRPTDAQGRMMPLALALAEPTGTLPKLAAEQVDSTRQMQQSCKPDAMLDGIAMAQKVRRAH